MKTHKMLLLSAMALLAVASAATAATGVDQNSPDLPPAGVYLSATDVHAMYSGGALTIVLSAVQHKPIADAQPDGTGPTRTAINGGMDVQEDFNSTINGLVSINGGPNMPLSGAGPVQVISYGNGPAGSPTGTFNTEMTSMLLDFGGGVQIRESPTLPSTGQTTVTSIGGGMYHIDSFFDVFTELTLDGGNSWIPSATSTHVDLFAVPEPASVALLGLGLVGLLAWRRNSRRAA